MFGRGRKTERQLEQQVAEELAANREALGAMATGDGRAFLPAGNWGGLRQKTAAGGQFGELWDAAAAANAARTSPPSDSTARQCVGKVTICGPAEDVAHAARAVTTEGEYRHDVKKLQDEVDALRLDRDAMSERLARVRRALEAALD